MHIRTKYKSTFTDTQARSQNLRSFSTNGDNVEFNLRSVDHGLHELIRDWLLDSTAPVS